MGIGWKYGPLSLSKNNIKKEKIDETFDSIKNINNYINTN